MSRIIGNTALSAPLQTLDVPFAQAKAGLHKMEVGRQGVGSALRRAIAIVGLTDKEAAALIGVDPSELSRWLRGDAPVNLARIYSTKLHGPFAIEMARDAEGCVVETTVTYRSER